ncbi:MAG TPA: hypothetical protein VIN08_16405 [Ohtaekwangia sp.]|uniref:hypothetical protein n=1 Tax=Ohtaekwangia sp. TaxID=2066019 RepID=UPI002F95B532
MIKRLLLASVYLLSVIAAEAQEEQQPQQPSYDTHRFFLGLDLMRTFPLVFNRGYVLEPSLIYKTNDHTIIDLAVGFNDIRKDELYSNVAYANTGRYYRVSIGRFVANHRTRFNEFNLQAGLIYSDFTEKGSVTFAGDNYGDLTDVKTQHNKLFILEFQPNYWLPISDKFSFNFQVRVNYIVTQPDEKYFPVYYVPGAGYVQSSGNRDGIPNSNSITGGVSIRIVYKFLEL